ncbi:MAG: hypothetical protein AABY15_04185 [Nanoarchaeota archaeon]
MATANQAPINVLHREVNFTTTNLLNGEVFVEPHTVSGPTPQGTFNIPLNGVNIVGSKTVIPLQSTTGQGSYWLKIHKPQPGSSTLYITFAQKNSAMADGYYDYVTGIPSGFRSALRSWIADNPSSLSISPVTYVKSLLFTVYGIDTNQVSSAVQFRVSFKAVIGGTSTTGSSVVVR